MSGRWKRLGAAAADVPYCNAFARQAAGWGWSEAQIDSAVTFALKNQHQGWETFEPLAIHHARQNGVEDIDLDRALSWGDQVLETPAIRDALDAQSFVESYYERSPTKGSADRLAEIERIMREDAHSYWGNEALQNEYAALIGAREGSADAPALPSATDRRRSEIEALMRQDGGRGYWNRPEVQSEYASLVEASQPAQEAAADVRP
jgi:hypothetical protein